MTSKEGNTWVRSGPPGYYASVRSKGPKLILSGIGYAYLPEPGATEATKVRSRDYIIEPTALSLLAYANPTTGALKPLSSFLLTLYKAKVDLTGSARFDLEQNMRDAGIFEGIKLKEQTINTPKGPVVGYVEEWADPYEDLQMLDILVLLGAKRLPNFEKYFPSEENQNPEPRPELHEVEDIPGGIENVFKFTEHLGLPGLLRRLYVVGGISFEHLRDCARFFYPEPYQRERFYKEELNPYMRIKNHPTWSEKQIQDFTK